MAKLRTNTIPIVEDARHPQKYRMLVQMVDVIFADVAQPDQARIIALNAHHFLKNGGAIVISIKANCIDSTAPAAQVFASEVNIMRKEGIKPKGESYISQTKMQSLINRAIDIGTLREGSRYRCRQVREAPLDGRGVGVGGRCKRRWPRDVGRFIISPLVCVCRARTIVAPRVADARDVAPRYHALVSILIAAVDDWNWVSIYAILFTASCHDPLL
jgi:hypothetical protein